MLPARYLPLIEGELEAQVKALILPAAPLYGMLRYFLGWQDEQGQPVDDPRLRGKRLRPTLTLLVCQAAGGQLKDALPWAAAIELFHNFSLIHDDIEDHDEFRRHRPTLWKLYGVEQAINAGDALLLAAFRTTEQTNHPRHRQISSALSATWQTIAEGQFLDMSFEGRHDVAVKEYLAMIEAKTGVLVAASMRTGALIATDDERLAAAYERAGLNLGLSYQIFDDIASVWATTAQTGKEGGGDIVKKKKTLPFIYALSKLPALDRKRLLAVYRQQKVTRRDVATVIRLFDQVKAREFCREVGQKYQKQALAALQETGITNSYQDELIKLAKDIVD